MTRLPRLCPAGIALHVVQRGNNRQNCFFADADCAAYAGWLREATEKYKLALHAWVFMSNHVHLLLTPSDDGAVSQMMQAVGRNYVRYFNERYSRTGTLWEGRSRSCVVQEDNYLLACQRYIELNPVRAGMVSDPLDYHWSSYRTNALGIPSALHTAHPAYLALGTDGETRSAAYRSLFRNAVDDHLVDEIRMATRRNLAFGDARFKAKIERVYDRRVRPLRAGRSRKSDPEKDWGQRKNWGQSNKR